MLTLAERSPILFTKTIYEIKEGGGGFAPVGSASYGHEFQNRLTSTENRKQHVKCMFQSCKRF